jgi:hypothetical protein
VLLYSHYLDCNWLHTRYIVSAPTTQKIPLYCWLAPTAQKTSHAAAIVARRLTAAEMCLPLCSSNKRDGRGAATLFTVACVTQQRAINTRTSIVARVFRGFCVSTAVV